MLDPRHRNEAPEVDSAASFLDTYAERLSETLRAGPIEALLAAVEVLERAAASGGRVLVIGNGGSAAMADHIACDLVKGTQSEGWPTIDVMSLNANGALYTAAANDFGFEFGFARQIGFLGRPGDVLIAISSSGTSANILRAVEAARERDITVIGMSGFGGGLLRELADVALYANVRNYGLVEDAHMAWIHVIAQIIARRRDGSVGW